MTKIKLSKTRVVMALIIFILVPQVNAQTDTLKNLPNLLLPHFTRSIVVMKSGEKRTAALNYNLVDQEMVFMQKNLYWILDEPQLIDTIYMANRMFVPFEKGFYELAVAAPVTLFIQHKSYAESLGVPTGYGAMSQTAPPNYVAQIYGPRGAVNLEIPSNVKVVDDTEYWIRKEGMLQKFNSKRLFLKIFPDKEKELEQYIKKNKVDFKNQQSLVNLVLYCNELYK
jgi:hypothetical protein